MKNDTTSIVTVTALSPIAYGEGMYLARYQIGDTFAMIMKDALELEHMGIITIESEA